MHRRPNYLYLLIGMSAAIVVVASTGALTPSELVGVAGGGVILVMTAYLVTQRKPQLLLAVAFGASALLPIAWFRIHPAGLPIGLAQTIYALDLLFWVLLTLTTTIIVFRGIIMAEKVRANEVFGAIYVYLLIGVIFAQVYQLLLAIQPGALYFPPDRFAPPREMASGLFIRGPGDLVYFSFITLATVGYGDITPATPAARAVTMIEVLVGVMYVATMIARFVSIQTGGRASRS